MEEQIHSDILRCAFIHQAKIMALWLIPVAVAQTNQRCGDIKQAGAPFGMCAALSAAQSHSFELSPPFLMTPCKFPQLPAVRFPVDFITGVKREGKRKAESDTVVGATHYTTAQPEATPARRGPVIRDGPPRQVIAANRHQTKPAGPSLDTPLVFEIKVGLVIHRNGLIRLLLLAV